MTKLLLINGPKSCGKTELVKRLKTKFKDKNFVDVSCKVPLHSVMMQYYNFYREEDYFHLYTLEGFKEQPNQVWNTQMDCEQIQHLEGIVGKFSNSRYLQKGELSSIIQLSMREAMIYLSEVIIKPEQGEDYFGRVRNTIIKTYEGWQDIVLFDDSSSSFKGESLELNGLTDVIPEDDILLIRILGRGAFDGDSRGYHKDVVVKNTIDVYNDTDNVEDFLAKAVEVVEEFLSK